MARGGSLGNLRLKSLKETGIDHFLYAKNDSDKISDRLGTLKIKF